MKEAVAVVFGFGLIINALLFVPQGLAIWRTKSSQGVSILTFCGFSAMQAIGVLHGYYQQDWALVTGMGVSFLACSSVTALAITYRAALAGPAKQNACG